MSDDKPTQAVVTETETPVIPGVEVESAREEPSLDALLAQYDKDVQPADRVETQPDRTLETNPETPTRDPRVDKLIERQIALESQADMDATLKDVRGNLDPQFFDDTIVRAWIDGEAARDPRLARAWVNRKENPKQFEQVKAALGRNFAKKFSRLPDRQATEDRELVTASVRGASTKAPEGKAPEFAKLNNKDFSKEVQEKYGFNPGV